MLRSIKYATQIQSNICLLVGDFDMEMEIDDKSVAYSILFFSTLFATKGNHQQWRTEFTLIDFSKWKFIDGVSRRNSFGFAHCILCRANN